MDLNRQFEIEKSNRLRVAISWIVFIILIGLGLTKYISYAFALMISIPLMAFIIWYNSIKDENNNRNKERIFILALFLGVISWNYYSLQIESKKDALKMHKECSNSIDDFYLCNKLYGFISPNENIYWLD